MKKRRKINIFNLSFLYMNYIFNIVSIIIFLISLILIVLSLLYLANPNLDLASYIVNPSSYHKQYFHQAIFILSIFNSIIITCIVIILIKESESFDSLFIASSKRIDISISKIISSFIIIVILSTFEFVILYLYPLLIFKDFKIEYSDLNVIIYLILQMSFLLYFEMMLTNLIVSIFIPMTCLFLNIVKDIFASTFKSLMDTLELFLPILKYENNHIRLESLYVIPLWLMFFLMVYIFSYNIKDINI